MKRIIALLAIVLSCATANAESVRHSWDSGLVSNSTATIDIQTCVSCTDHQFQFYTNGTSYGTFTLTGLDTVGSQGTEYVVTLLKNGGLKTTNSTTKTDFVFPSVRASHSYITTTWGVKYWGW